MGGVGWEAIPKYYNIIYVVIPKYICINHIYIHCIITYVICLGVVLFYFLWQ